jgi:hypothetical protein
VDGTLLFDRVAQIRFPGIMRDLTGAITFAQDEGPRIAFAFERSIRAEPDRGIVRCWNLPKELVDRIVSDHTSFQIGLKNLQRGITSFTKTFVDPTLGANSLDLQANRMNDQERSRRLFELLEQHIVEVWAGYGADPQMIFRGDIISIRPKVRDGLNYVTEIELGDGFVALQEQWMAQSYGVGETLGNLLAGTMALAEAGTNDGRIRSAIGIVAPNAITAKINNAYVAQGRPLDAIKEIADFLKIYWWIRDGKVELVERGKYLPDFAIALDADRTLISTSLTDDGKYRAFDCVLAPQVHPGRAIEIHDEWGDVHKTRVLETRIQGDTHGAEWHISGIGEASDFAILPTLEPSLGPIREYKKGEYERLTDPRTGGQSIPKALRMAPR